MNDKEHLYVSTIAQCGSVTKAAEQLYISQPSLTQALHRLEAEYGSPFFHRGRGGLLLTRAGRTYLEAADRMEQLFQKMQYDIEKASGLLQGQLNLGITAFQGGILLPEVLNSYRQQHPLVDLKLMESSSAQLEQLAYEGRLDLIILHRPFRDYELKYIPLHKEEFYLAVSPENDDYLGAVAQGGYMPILDRDILNRQEFLMLTANQRIRQVADNVCTLAGVVPKIRFSTSSFMTALAMVEKDMGATFVPASFANFYRNRYRVAYFRFPLEWNAGWELVAAYAGNNPLSQLCMEFIRVTQECIAEMPEVFR